MSIRHMNPFLVLPKNICCKPLELRDSVPVAVVKCLFWFMNLDFAIKAKMGLVVREHH